MTHHHASRRIGLGDYTVTSNRPLSRQFFDSLDRRPVPARRLVPRHLTIRLSIEGQSALRSFLSQHFGESRPAFRNVWLGVRARTQPSARVASSSTQANWRLAARVFFSPRQR